MQSGSEVAQSCPTLCDPVDCKLPGSSIHGIFQARVLEWVAISFSQIVSYWRGKMHFLLILFPFTEPRIVHRLIFFSTFWIRHRTKFQEFKLRKEVGIFLFMYKMNFHEPLNNFYYWLQATVGSRLTLFLAFFLNNAESKKSTKLEVRIHFYP